MFSYMHIWEYFRKDNSAGESISSYRLSVFYLCSRITVVYLKIKFTLVLNKSRNLYNTPKLIQSDFEEKHLKKKQLLI